DPREPMKCALELTNGMAFWYERGHVSLFDDRPHNSVENASSPTFTNNFFGTLNMTKGEALGLVRRSMSNLGYSVKQSLVDLEPAVVMPPIDGTNIIPHCIFKWPSLSPSGTVEAEVDAQRKTIVDLTLFSEVFERDPPRIPVTPKWRSPDPGLNPAYVSDLI